MGNFPESFLPISTCRFKCGAYLTGLFNVIVLSTDKAVYPINAMGMSKALLEKLTIAKARTVNEKVVLCGTRYGNVIASRGSVIPLFVGQIKEEMPLTVTVPSIPCRLGKDTALESNLISMN